jgi:hypothetical protein
MPWYNHNNAVVGLQNSKVHGTPQHNSQMKYTNLWVIDIGFTFLATCLLGIVWAAAFSNPKKYGLLGPATSQDYWERGSKR